MIRHPELLGTAVDEFMRYYSPAGSARYVERDVTVGGVDLTAGQTVMGLYHLIHRDPRQFANPDVFIPDRSPNRHLGLGAGIHRCLGAHLVRVEAMVVVAEVLKRLPEFELDGARPPVWLAGQAGGLTSVPVTFHPGGVREFAFAG